MTNEEIIDYILYERLLPIIDSFTCLYFKDGDEKGISQLRELYLEWHSETEERIYFIDYIEDNPDCFFNECESLLCKEIGHSMLFKSINRNDYYHMLSQMKFYMLKDKDNPFFKLKRTELKKQDIEQDFR